MKINLNLIPLYRREEIEKSRHFRLVVRIEAILFMFVLFFFAFLFSLSHILDLNMEIVSQNPKASGEKNQYDKISGYDEKFKQINSQVENILKIKRDQLYWSKMFSHLGGAVFSGISIQSMATKEYAVFLVGKADNRDNLIKFKEKLEKDDCFSSVNLPLSNLVSKGDVDFQMDLELKEDCIKFEK